MVLTVRLLRHGATEWTDAGRYCGHTDVPLTAAGRASAQALGLQGEHHDHVLTSDLRRCVETAEAMGLAATPTAALREFDFGELEGLRWEELDDTTQRRLVEFDGFVAPGGESVAAFGRRIDDCVDALPDGHHLLITHGGVIRHLLRRHGTDTRVAPGTWIDLPISRR